MKCFGTETRKYNADVLGKEYTEIFETVETPSGCDIGSWGTGGYIQPTLLKIPGVNYMLSLSDDDGETMNMRVTDRKSVV